MEEAQVDGMNSELSGRIKCNLQQSWEPDAATAKTSLSELITDLSEREFRVSPDETEPTTYLEKDALHTFELHGWAGSGLEGKVDLTKLGQDLGEKIRIVFRCTGRLPHRCQDGQRAKSHGADRASACVIIPIPFGVQAPTG